MSVLQSAIYLCLYLYMNNLYKLHDAAESRRYDKSQTIKMYVLAAQAAITVCTRGGNFLHLPESARLVNP